MGESVLQTFYQLFILQKGKKNPQIQQRQYDLLTGAIFLLVCLLSISYFLILSLTNFQNILEVTIGYIFFLTPLLIAYFFSRRRKYTAAAFLYVLSHIPIIYTSISASYLGNNPLYSNHCLSLVFFFLIPLFISVIFLPPLYTTFFTLIIIPLLFTYPYFFPQIAFESVIKGPFAFILIFYFFIIFLHYYNDSLEQNRQQKLKESQEKYQTIFEQTKTILVCLNKDNTIKDINGEAQRLYNTTRLAAVGKDFFHSFVPIEEHHFLKNNLRAVFAGQKKFHFINEVSTKKGTSRIIIWDSVAQYDANGQIFGVILSGQDITSVKKHEQALLEKEHYLRSIFEQMISGFAIGEIVYDESHRPIDYRYVQVNPAFERITGLPRTHVQGKTATQLFPNVSRQWIDRYVKIAITGNPMNFEDYRKDLDRTFEVSAFQIKPGQFATIFSDITEAKKSREKIKEQNQKLQELNTVKNVFLNITSHELRTPMTAISGHVEMLLGGMLGEISEEQKCSLETILRNTKRLNHLVQDVLDFSRLESGTMKFAVEDVDMDELIDHTAETMQSAADFKSITIDVITNHSLPHLSVDKERISQVIINLLNNAIKYSPEQGIISLSAYQKDDMITIEIHDQGRGIPADQLDKVFEPFHQVNYEADKKFKGAGIGLTISKGIVLAHGGNIWVESVVGKGSTFKFTLPLCAEKDLEARFKESMQLS